MSLGAAQVSVDETCVYAKSPESMGKPSAGYQAISLALAASETLLGAARLVCYKSLRMRDAGQRYTTEGAMWTWWVPEVTLEIVG